MIYFIIWVIDQTLKIENMCSIIKILNHYQVGKRKNIVFIYKIIYFASILIYIDVDLWVMPIVYMHLHSSNELLWNTYYILYICIVTMYIECRL